MHVAWICQYLFHPPRTGDVCEDAIYGIGVLSVVSRSSFIVHLFGKASILLPPSYRQHPPYEHQISCRVRALRLLYRFRWRMLFVDFVLDNSVTVEEILCTRSGAVVAPSPSSVLYLYHSKVLKHDELYRANLFISFQYVPIHLYACHRTSWRPARLHSLCHLPFSFYRVFFAAILRKIFDRRLV